MCRQVLGNIYDSSIYGGLTGLSNPLGALGGSLGGGGFNSCPYCHQNASMDCSINRQAHAAYHNAMFEQEMAYRDEMVGIWAAQREEREAHEAKVKAERTKDGRHWIMRASFKEEETQ